jgi:predicted SnoaL-like aldol condensation-catalyzing enzyme
MELVRGKSRHPLFHARIPHHTWYCLATPRSACDPRAQIANTAHAYATNPRRLGDGARERCRIREALSLIERLHITQACDAKLENARHRLGDGAIERPPVAAAADWTDGHETGRPGALVARPAILGIYGDTMSLEENKTVAVDFYETAFRGEPEKAVADHVGGYYTQHNPQAADGTEGVIAFVHWIREQYPHLHLDIKRVIAEGDLVVTHSQLMLSPDGPSWALADFFRLEDGNVVEHWDVIQEVPETFANTNGMF